MANGGTSDDGLRDPTELQRWWRRTRNTKEALQFARDLEKSGISYDSFVVEASLFQQLVPPPLALAAPEDDRLVPVRLLDGEWLLRRAEALRAAPSREARAALALPRRQDLDEQAFMSVPALKQLPRGDARIGRPLPIVCVSHCWHGPVHPDPYGDNLLILADAIRKRRDPPEATAFPTSNFAVFYDWCSLCQRDESGMRTEAEEACFRRALLSMQLWYAHKLTLVYMLTATPLEWSDVDGMAVTPYAGRGWPQFERLVSSLIKMRSSKCWHTIVDVNDEDAKPSPPMTAAAFGKQLRTSLIFTNGADRGKVSSLYRNTLHTALGQARSLRYVGLNWGDKEMVTLCQVLPLCKQCRCLNLKGSHNKYTAEAASKLAAALCDRRTLPKLRLLGVGSRARDSNASDDPMLSSTALQRACATRDIALGRDVDEDKAALLLATLGSGTGLLNEHIPLTSGAAGRHPLGGSALLARVRGSMLAIAKSLARSCRGGKSRRTSNHKDTMQRVVEV